MRVKIVPARFAVASWPDAARWLLLVEFASLFLSTSLMSVVEILLLLTVLACLVRERELLLGAARQPVVVMAAAFAVVILLGLAYGDGLLADRIEALKGWRKLLLLPVAALLLSEPRWKQRLLWTLIGAATVGMLFSYAGFLGIYGDAVTVHNHATQGIFFAAAAFAATVAALDRSLAIRPACRWLLGVGGVLWIINIVFITPGRSGYLALLVLSGVAALAVLRGWVRIGLAVAAPLLILALLGLSPVASQRLTLAVDEARGFQQAEEYSSLGIRMVMWSNTWQLVRERPLFGHGTGGLREAYRRQVADVPGWRGIVVDDPHNQFLKVAVEQGAVGLLIFLGFIGAFFRQQVPPPYRIFGLGILLAWCATSLFSGHFSTWAEGRFLLIWAGGQLAMPCYPASASRGQEELARSSSEAA